jgi:predicted HTH transcriptional regulator
MSDHTFVDLSPAPSSDSLPARDVTIDYLDLDLVAAHVERATAQGRYNGSAEPLSYLRRKRCVVEVDGTLYATRAGILCFGRKPQELIPHAVVDLGHYRGTEQISLEVVHLEKSITGTLFDQIARIESYLWREIHHGMRVAPNSFQRVDLHEYPQIVIRELCVNMLAHRDYEQVYSASRVMLFRNRIEWATPGGLPPRVTVENLLAAQVSRNPVILSIFYEAGYGEAFGQGLDTVVAVLKAEGQEPPEFVDTGESFVVRIFGRQLEVAVNTNELALILNSNQRRIFEEIRIRGVASPQDIRDALPARGPRSIQRDIERLIDLQLVEALGSARAIRYRLRE